MNEIQNNDTVAKMAQFPQCDFCENIAGYDAQVRGPKENTEPSVVHANSKSWITFANSWAYFCEEHFISKSHQKLGLGLGQKLVLIEGTK